MSEKSGKKSGKKIKTYTVEQLSEVSVGKLMTTGVITVKPTNTLQYLQHIWIEHDLDTFPVTEKGELVGIVSKIDFLGLFYIQPTETRAIPMAFKITATKVKDIMKKEFYTVTEEDPVNKAIALIVDNRLRSLPVVNKGKLVGIISRMDIIRSVQLETPDILK